MNVDISHLLEKWDYVPGEVTVRKFAGKDGVEKIQLRIDLGILQMSVTGRPDGKRPLGHDSLREHYLQQLDRHKEKHQGSDEGFRLAAADCNKLLQEAVQYHHRYLCLYQLKDYAGILRDTERNLEVFDFVNQYAENEELSWSLQQFRPQLLMIRTRAFAELATQADDYAGVVAHVEEGLQALREFYRHFNREDLLEQSSEVRSLENWLEDLRLKRPRSEREMLETALTDAIRREDYEKAAQFRDALRQLKEQL